MLEVARQRVAENGLRNVTLLLGPTIIGGSTEEEARQALMMGPTARLIEAKKPSEAVRHRG